MKKYISPVYNRKSVIVFDGSSYYGLFAEDVEDAKAEDPDIEIVETFPAWNDEMDQRIEDLNNEM